MKLKAILVLGILALVIVVPASYYTTEATIVVTVSDKERIVTKESSYYLVYTDKETFKNSDDFFYGKWGSSDLQGKLKPETSYRLKVIGWRVPFFSWYRNIISAETSAVAVEAK